MTKLALEPQYIEEERQIQQQIYNAIDKFENIIFNAGAGSGKTFALIESLKYILKMNEDALQKTNQQIVCITYTNVAVNEIKTRLGNSDLVAVSTIHEKLWSFIKQHQKELLIIHAENVKETLDLLRNDLLDNDDEKVKKTFQAYRGLTPELKTSFTTYVLENKDKFYKCYDLPAAKLKVAFNTDLASYNGILSNVGNFKKTVSTLYKINSFEECLKKMDEKADGFTTVKYDSRFNSDKLHKMIFSHDTLLAYALKMVKRYDLLKQIIMDSHPYILIDEYQDTHPNVIQIMNLISIYGNEIKHPLFVGYFGDTAQNIYNDGVGREINVFHPNLSPINKKFNRRSTENIVSVINKIRNDEIKQESIYQNFIGNDVEFYQLDSFIPENRNQAIISFIEKCCIDWNIRKDNPLHCLVLTNRLVAELSGFSNLYNAISKSQYYKKNYQYLNTELLSNDLTKLGEVSIILHRIIKLKVSLETPHTPLTAILSKEVYSNLTFSGLQELLSELKSITGDSLNEYIISIFKDYETRSLSFKKVMDEIFDLERLSYSTFFNYVLNKLNPNLDDEIEEEVRLAKNLINELLNVNLDEYLRWYYFVENKQTSEVIYHTYHGTKGVEFENVVVIGENDFGLDKRKFSNYFQNISNSVLNDDESKKFENTKNLLYVSCSRAIRNLRVLYLDDISDFSSGIVEVFGEIQLYPA